MDRIILENESISVGIRHIGAELCSIFNKRNKTEYLWQADPKYWPRHAPVLFPIVGSLNGGEYLYKNQRYSLPRHGFARDKKFICTEQKLHSACFSLLYDSDTLLSYPFQYELKLEYEIDENHLKTTATVINKSTENELLFSIGFHPAFNVPLDSNTTFEDYYLSFNKDTCAKSYQLEDGLLSEITNPVLTNGQLKINQALFKNDALVFKGLCSDEVSLKSDKTDRSVLIQFEKFPYFGVWTSQDAPFLCLEPWHGITDSVANGGELESKEGIIRLEPSDLWRCSYIISIK